MRQTPDVWLLLASKGRAPLAPLCPSLTIVAAEPNLTGTDAVAAPPIYADATVMIGRMGRDARRRVGASLARVVGAVRELVNRVPNSTRPTKPSNDAPRQS